IAYESWKRPLHAPPSIVPGPPELCPSQPAKTAPLKTRGDPSCPLGSGVLIPRWGAPGFSPLITERDVDGAWNSPDASRSVCDGRAADRQIVAISTRRT